ncbi:hypothetical protein D9611_010689 [Ephemerocybe angulata]|uniref:Enoyl reductase (ER) domain-containing protein n=1 Tax=Ephemerocybe angulata TaxID=980116 RepID=A0A8H5BC87_9AGAR|nr:hypothetical protein D9611_010689 [Tulosesus angulatus]
MVLTKNGRLLFNSVPVSDGIVPGTLRYDESETIDLDAVPLNGGALFKLLAVSADPLLTALMSPAYSESAFEHLTYKIGKPIIAYAVIVALRSEIPTVKAGDHFMNMFPLEEYFIIDSLPESTVPLPNYVGIPWSTYVGVCGMPGQTAYMGWKEYSKAKKGETAFVTAGAGPVGSFVIQMAKRDGLKVIASAGSDEKVELMKSFGADVAFNYKTANTLEILEREGGIDVFWDNVGGVSLDAALQASRRKARFLECGMMAAYGATDGPNAIIKNIWNIVGKSITMVGFLVWDLYEGHLDDFYTTVPKLVADGEIKYKEDVTMGLGSLEDAMIGLFKGTNVGKAVVIVADE